MEMIQVLTPNNVHEAYCQVHWISSADPCSALDLSNKDNATTVYTEQGATDACTWVMIHCTPGYIPHSPASIDLIY